MTDTAALAEAAEKLRALAETAQHDLETADYWKPYEPARAWRDGHVNGFGGVSSDYVAVLPPTVGLALADWLGCLAMHEPAERSGGECAWCGSNHAETVARALTQPTA
ncbi:hypothetical protein ACFC8N_42635 [Streptomyces sp. NPDC055966]|uniref:hypothetical protein n=1 Tax=Streptomyces sp. NPDC055966 TaxID=3345669 RepID=UPI0035D87858